MAYSDFTLREVAEQFHLTRVDVPDLFAAIPEQRSSTRLTVWVEEFSAPGLAINTYKARSEYVVAPSLGELRAYLAYHVSLFSGVELTVDVQLAKLEEREEHPLQLPQVLGTQSHN